MRPMDPNHANALKNILGIEQDDMHPLPQEVIDRYWLVKRCSDQIGASFGSSEILLVAMHFASKIPEQEIDFRVQVREAGLQTGEHFAVKWKSRWRPAVFYGFKGQSARAVVDSDETGEMREFAFKDCKLVESEAETTAA